HVEELLVPLVDGDLTGPRVVPLALVDRGLLGGRPLLDDLLQLVRACVPFAVSATNGGLPLPRGKLSDVRHLSALLVLGLALEESVGVLGVVEPLGVALAVRGAPAGARVAVGHDFDPAHMLASDSAVNHQGVPPARAAPPFCC